MIQKGIKLIKMKDPSLKWRLLSEFRPQTDCLIVSDVKTKLAVEEELLKKHKVLPGSCVLRASEFYKEIFFLLSLNWNLTPDVFVRELFSEFCEGREESWIKNPKGLSQFFDFFDMLLPLLIHPEGVELFQEWSKQKQKSDFFKSLWNLSQEFFNNLKSKKILHESSLKALLFNHLPDLKKLPFPKDRIFVDLNFSLDLCEKGIFQEISRHKELCILSPELSFTSDLMDFQDQDLLSGAYQKLEKELSRESIVSLPDFLNQKVESREKPAEFFKVKNESTSLEEIRKAVAQIHSWRARGIAYRDISLFAPHIENYWFALKLYLEKEKIPFKKTVVSRVKDFPDISYFLSALRMHLGYFSFEDLEHFVFHKKPRGGFSEFKSHYFHIPNRSLSQNFLFHGKKLSAHEKITGREFVKWALALWPKEGDFSLLEQVLLLFQNFPMEGELKAESWLRLLESRLSSMEIEMEEENSEGISCLSFNAFSSSLSPYVFIMDLNDQSLKSSSVSVFNEREKESLLRDLDFPLPLKLPKEKEYGLAWFLQSSHLKEVYLSYSPYNFKGDVQTQSLFYLCSESLYKAQTPEEDFQQTLWDQSRKLSRGDKAVSQILSFSSVPKEMVQNIERAFRNSKQEFFHAEKFSLSSNRLKTYRDCPFKYAGKKLFYVDEKTFVEQELSAMLKGSLAHSLFEKFLDAYKDCSANENQIEELIEQIVDEQVKEKNLLIHEKQSLLIKGDLKQLLKSFIAKEKECRAQYPDLEPLAFEKEFFMVWDQQEACLKTQEEKASEGQYEFKGQIDRIDKDEKKGIYVLRDYKSSDNDLTQISSWCKEGKEDLQLTVYAQALQKGGVKGRAPGEIHGLFYSIFKDDFSIKGFVDEKSLLKAFVSGRAGSKKGQNVLTEAIEKSNELTKKIVQSMEKGQFSPQPREEKICKTCAYRSWCRVESLKNV